MREAIRDKSRLEHILQAIDTILSNKDRYTLDTVSGDPIAYYGFVKHIEIIGEAVYMLTKEFKEAHPEVEWEVIEGMRHVLVHGYYSIKPFRSGIPFSTTSPPFDPRSRSCTIHLIKLF